MDGPRVGVHGVGTPSDDVSERLAASERKLEALARLAQTIAVGDDIQTVLSGVASTFAEALGFPECNIYEYSPTSGTFRVIADYDADDRRPVSDWLGTVCSQEEVGVGTQALASGEPVIIASLDDPQLGAAERALMQRFGENSMLMIPMNYAGRQVGVIELCERDPTRVISEEEVSIAQAMGNHAVTAIENAKSLGSLRAFHMNSLRTLASALKAKDPYTHGHASRVAAYAVFLCRELDIDEELTSELEKACYLHDIGKIGITDRILQKRGRLNMEERALMQSHPTISASIIEPLFSPEVIEAVRHHHESWDGNGYPDGLQGEDIPLLARLMHVVDSYDAMSYSRPYARARSYERAIEELQRGAGTQFDPQLVPPLLRVLERMAEVQGRATAVAEEVAALIDGDEHARLVGRFQEESPTYKEMIETLRRVRAQHPEVRYITTAALREDGARFVLDAEEDPELCSHIGDEYPYAYDTPLLTQQWFGRLDSGDLYATWFAGEENVLYVDEWGMWVTGAATIRNRRGVPVAVVNVDVPAVEMASLDSSVHRVFNMESDESATQLATTRVLSITDELTGLYNHSFFQEQLDQELRLAAEDNHAVCVLLIDVDGLRSINEHRGFTYGDIMLHGIGQAIVARLRPYEVAARYGCGGAEFAVVFGDRELGDSAEFAESLRRQLVVVLTEAGESATVSIGVAACPDHAHDRATLLEAAHTALREAKAQGKNRVVVAS
jgi:diguanylate cyclase (GGDEF)-like protein/putative nucleotidyltransferase with HDIG domain